MKVAHASPRHSTCAHMHRSEVLGVNLHNSGFQNLTDLRKCRLNKGRETQVVAVGCGQHCFPVHFRAQYDVCLMARM